MASIFDINISEEEFFQFHKIDRELYEILVINLSRDPKESMKVLALWLWLEGVGYGNVVNKILSSPQVLINGLADEGVTCLNCINSSLTHLSFEDNDIPLMRSLIDKEISLQILYKNKILVIHGVATIFQIVCKRALGDIVKQINIRNSSESMVKNQQVEITSSDDHISFNSIQPSNMIFDNAEATKSNSTVMHFNMNLKMDDFDRSVFSVVNYVLTD